jgi:succinate dehydrogenase assembly factor 1
LFIWKARKANVMMTMTRIFTTPRFQETSPPHMAPRLSGLAKQALSLHRALLRAVRGKPAETRAGLVSRIRAEFEARRGLDAMRDMQQVEHYIRFGRKQLQRLMDPNVKAVGGG